MERAAFSIRAIARLYGVGRGTVSQAIQNGELPAARLGPRHTVVLRRDFEDWLRSHSARPSDFAADRVERVLEREARASVP